MKATLPCIAKPKSASRGKTHDFLTDRQLRYVLLSVFFVTFFFLANTLLIKRSVRYEKKKQLHGWIFCRIWFRHVGGTDFPRPFHSDRGGGGAGVGGPFVGSLLNFVREEHGMQVVIVKSPKFFGSILRKVFKIPKTDYPAS